MVLVACKSRNKEVVEETVAEDTPKSEITDIETVETAPEVMIMGYGEICDAFVATLQTGNSRPMEQYFPTLDLAKTIAPNETSGKTDEQIKTEMVDALINRFKENLHKLQEAAKLNRITLQSLTVKNCLYNESSDPETVPRVLNIEVMDNNGSYTIPVTVLKFENKTYVFEILNTQNVFR